MKTKKMKHFVVLIIFCFTTSSFLYCQNDSYKRVIGIGASIQDSEFGITIPIWISEKFVIAPAIGLKYAEAIGTDIAIGLMPKIYFNTEKLSPFVSFRFGGFLNIPSTDNTIDAENKLDYIIGLGFGAEYFLSPNFSFGVEAQANVTMSDEDSYRFGNPDGINFNFATAVTANIYFGK